MQVEQDPEAPGLALARFGLWPLTKTSKLNRLLISWSLFWMLYGTFRNLMIILVLVSLISVLVE